MPCMRVSPSLKLLLLLLWFGIHVSHAATSRAALSVRFAVLLLLLHGVFQNKLLEEKLFFIVERKQQHLHAKHDIMQPATFLCANLTFASGEENATRVGKEIDYSGETTPLSRSTLLSFIPTAYNIVLPKSFQRPFCEFQKESMGANKQRHGSLVLSRERTEQNAALWAFTLLSLVKGTKVSICGMNDNSP